MTREVAIKAIQDFIGWFKEDSLIRKALDMAIQALSQEPSRDMEEIAEIMKCDADAETKCKMISNILTAKPHYFAEQEPCDDAISRKAVLKLKHHKPEYGDMIYAFDVEQLPSVTQKSETVTEFADICRECGAKYGKLLKQKSGHWIWSDEIDRYVCDKCGQSDGKDKEMVESGEYPLSNYCHNCGCRMVEPQESEK